MKHFLLDTHYQLGNFREHTLGVVAVMDWGLQESALLEDPTVLGVTCSLSFQETGFKTRLEKILQHPKVKAVRQVFPQMGPIWKNGVKLLAAKGSVCEIELKEDQFYQLSEFAQQLPQASFILTISHPLRMGYDLKQISFSKNIAIKVLGGCFTFELMRSCILDLIDRFSTDRVMFGGFSESEYENLLKIVSDFTDEEKEKLFAFSAKSWYKLAS